MKAQLLCITFLIAALSGCISQGQAGESKFSVLPTNEFDRASFKLDEAQTFGKTLNAVDCNKENKGDYIALQCGGTGCQAGFRCHKYTLQLVDYGSFRPCTPCGEGAKDCVCSCGTGFKKGLAWVATRIDIMQTSKWYNADNGEMFCTSGGA